MLSLPCFHVRIMSRQASQCPSCVRGCVFCLWNVHAANNGQVSDVHLSEYDDARTGRFRALLRSLEAIQPSVVLETGVSAAYRVVDAFVILAAFLVFGVVRVPLPRLAGLPFSECVFSQCPQISGAQCGLLDGSACGIVACLALA